MLYELVPAKAITFRLWTFAPWLENEIWQGCAPWQCETTTIMIFLFSPLLQIGVLTFFYDFFGGFDPLWRTHFFFRKTTAVLVTTRFVLLWSTTVAKVAFQLSKIKVQKLVPCRVNDQGSVLSVRCGSERLTAPNLTVAFTIFENRTVGYTTAPNRTVGFTISENRTEPHRNLKPHWTGP